MPRGLPSVQKTHRLLSEAYGAYGQKYLPKALVGAGIGAGALAMPDEAEAMPLTPVEKAVVAEATKVLGKEATFARGKLWEIIRRLHTEGPTKWATWAPPSNPIYAGTLSGNRAAAIRMMRGIETRRGMFPVNLPEEEASSILQKLVRKGVVRNVGAGTQPSHSSRYQWGPHPEVRLARGLEPLPKGEGVIEHLLTRRGGRGAESSVSLEVLGPVAREHGYKVRASKVLQELADEGRVWLVPPGTHERVSHYGFIEGKETQTVKKVVGDTQRLDRYAQAAVDHISENREAIASSVRTLFREVGGPSPQAAWNRTRWYGTSPYELMNRHSLRGVLRRDQMGAVQRAVDARVPTTPPPRFIEVYNELLPQLEVEEGQRLARLAAEQAAQREDARHVFARQPSAIAPVTDALHRIIRTADDKGIVDYRKAKQLMPSEFQRFSKELGEAFSNQPTASVARLEQWKYEVGKHKYRYALERNIERHSMMRSVFPEASRVHFLQIWGSPAEMAPFQGHAYPASARHKGIPSVGWFKILDKGDAWVVEEIQSDMQARAQAALRQATKDAASPNPKMTGTMRNDVIQKATNDLQSIKDWADYGLATTLEEARKEGVPMVMVASPETVDKLWGGHLGSAKATMFYKDLPKKFGFKLESIKARIDDSRLKEAVFSSRIPLFIATTAGGVASLFSPKEAEAAPKIRLTGQQWKALQEKVLPVAKELMESKGAVEFDVQRRWWAKKLGMGSMFWNQAKDNDRFLKWVTPYVNKAIERDPELGRIAKGMIEIGTREGHPKYYSTALMNLHRALTHETPAANATRDLASEFGEKNVRAALLEQVPEGEPRDALKSTLDYWWNFVIGAGVGLGALTGGEEAKAAPKPPTRLVKSIASKLGGLSRANAKLAGMELMGKTVKEVRKGTEPWRYIVFEDGTYSVMHKKYIASLTSAEGEKAYTSMFEMVGKRDQREMLSKSFALRQARKQPPKTLVQKLAERAKHVEELGEEPPKRTLSSLLGGKPTPLPARYEEWMAKFGEPGAAKMKGKTAVEKAINSLETSKKTRKLSGAETYMLRRLKGISQDEAVKGLKINAPAIERMVQKLLGASK